MVGVVSTYFRMISFPHKGGIVAIDQITLLSIDSLATRSVPLTRETFHPYQHVGIGLLNDSSLIETFSLPPPSFLDKSTFDAYINIISCCTTCIDPWVVPDQFNINSLGDCMLLNVIKLDYAAIYLNCTTYFDPSSSINWVDRSLDYGTFSDPFSHTFSTDERIMDIMMPDDAP